MASSLPSGIRRVDAERNGAQSSGGSGAATEIIMATIGQLVINVGMDVANMTSSAEKAEKSFSSMVKGMERDAKTMRKDLNKLGSEFVTMGEYAIAAAGVALVAVVKHSFDTIDALGKTSDALGISTEKLAELQYAASLAGVDTEKFNSSMFTMTKNVADASMGIGKAQIAFKAMGIDVDALVGMAPDKQFELMADKIGDIENPAIRAQMAIKVFGTSGAEMLTVMKDGAEGLKGAAEEADALGLAISRVDAAKIEQANDAMQAAKGVFAGVGNTIAVVLAPTIEGLSKDFIKMGKDAGGWKDEIDTAFNFIIKAAGFVADAFDGIKLMILGIKLAFQGAAMIIIDNVEAIAKVVDAFMPLSKAADKSAKAMELMSDDMHKAIDKTKKDIGDLAKKMETPHNYKKVVDAYKKSSETIAKQAEKHYDQTQSLQDAKTAKFMKDCDEQAKKNQAMIDTMDKAALAYIKKSVVDTTSGQEKLRAEYEATVKEFSGGTEMQLKAQETAWTVYNDKLKIENGKVAAEMRDKNYDALVKMVQNTEDKSGEAVDKRKAAMLEMEKRDNEWGQNFIDQFGKAVGVSGAATSMYEELGKMGTAWGDATKGTLASAINDGIMGTPKTAEQYGQALGGQMSAAFSSVAATYIIQQMAEMYATMSAMATAAGSADGLSYSLGWKAALVALFMYATKDIWGPFFVLFRDNWDDILEYTNATWKEFWSVPSYEEALRQINDFQFNGKKQIDTLIETVHDFNEAWDVDPVRDIKNFLTEIQKLLKDGFGGISITNPFTPLQASINDLKKFISKAGDIFIDPLKAAFSGVKIDDPFKPLKDTVQWLIDNVKNIPGVSALSGGDVVSNIGNTVSDVFNPSSWSFAKGGIMTTEGPLPLKTYASGGIADRPQMAIFGEGRMNEAYVPLPDGKSIPVTMKGDNQQGGDIVLMLDGQILGRILNGMSKQGRLKLDPIAIQSAYAV